MKKKHEEWVKQVKQVNRDNKFGPLKMYRNEEGALHRDNAPAYVSPTTLISYTNGNRHGISCDIWGSVTYYFDDVLIPKDYILNPEGLKFEDVIQHPNAEVRSVGIRAYGFQRMLDEERFDVVEIEKDTNYMLLKWAAQDPDESFCIVRVFNGTVNDDGSRDTYYLVVPPSMTTVREAVAWTFYKEADEYDPVCET